MAALVTMAVLTAVPMGASAQVPDADARAEQLAELDAELEYALDEIARLEPLAEAEREARRLARAEAQSIPVDTMLAGPLTVVTPVEQREVVERVTTRSLEYYDELAPGWRGEVRPITVVARMIELPAVAPIHVAEKGVGTVETPFGDGEEGLEGRFVSFLGSYLWHTLPSSIQHWAPSPLTEASRRPGLGPSAMYRLLASKGSPAVESCMERVAVDCWSAFGVGDARPTRWYAARDQRHRVVASITGDWFDRLEPEQQSHYRSCEVWDIEACDAFAASFFRTDSPPLAGLPRNTLVAHALVRGGSGAYARLVNSESEDPREMLAAAAGMDADALVLDWVDTVIGARPDAQPDLLAGFGAAMVWSVLLLGFVVVRSPRELN